MIRNRAVLERSSAHAVALDCVAAGIEAAHPERVVRDAVHLDGDELRIADGAYDLGDYDEVVVVGGGKAAAQVAVALEAVLGDRLTRGAVVTNDPEKTVRVEVLAGDHPVPSEEDVESTRRVLELVEGVDEDTLVLAVVTGGGSALLAAPAGGISLADLQATTGALLDSGATIHEMNAVRKHLSAVKGGQLARTAAPATVVSLVFSDVVGDDLDVIASGPTVPDTSTFDDALDVLDRYDVAVPEAVRERLERGAAGDIPETPDAGDSAFARTAAHVLADSFTALSAARDAADAAGFDALVLSSRVRGEAREAAKVHAGIAEECAATGNPASPPVVLLSGGETTVTVRGSGSGGRNQEFALSAALELEADAVVASVDTDGIDGSTDAAGAIVDADTVEDTREAQAALADNDAFGFFGGRDALVYTGKTGTNVNDLRVLVVR
jgi:hydroxypyruvate reductase